MNNNKTSQRSRACSVVDGDAVNVPKTSPTYEEEFLVLWNFQNTNSWTLRHDVVRLSRFSVGFLQPFDGHLQGELNATR